MFICNRFRNCLRRAGECCAVLAGILGGQTLWNWGADIGDLFTFGTQYVPMAPSTAWVLVLLSLAVFLHHRAPGHRMVVGFAYGVSGVAALGGLWAVLRTLFGWGSPFEVWLTQSTKPLDDLPVGLMSPFTGGIIMAAAAALALRLPPQGVRAPARRVSGGIALAVMAAGVGVAASYAAGEPWFYGGSIIPMAFWTAVAMALVGLGIFAMPSLAAFDRASDESSVLPGRITSLAPLVIAAFMTLVIGSLSAYYLRHQQRQDREDARELLKAIGTLKVSQIANWRQERLDDARFFANASFVARDIQSFLADPASGRKRDELLRWLTLLKAGERYQLVALFDSNAMPRLTVPSNLPVPPVLQTNVLAEVLESRAIVMSELYRTEESGHAVIDLLLPVFAPADSADGTGRSAAEPSPLLGLVLLRLDPRQFLYPMLRTWPAPNRTAETVLCRREGDAVVILNPLDNDSRHAPPWRRTIGSMRGTPAIVAVQEVGGQVEGRDYRGVPVLADIRAIPGSSWRVVVKIDRDELYGALRRQAGFALALTAVLAAIAGLALWLIWKYRSMGEVRRELQAERERRALAERVEHLMRNANDIIVLADGNNRILEASDRALEAYGYSLAEMQRLTLSDLRLPEEEAEAARPARALADTGRSVFETMHRRKDGTGFPVEVSARFVDIVDVRYTLEIVRDITSRKAHEREIERLTRLYETLSQVNECIMRGQSRAELFKETCRIAVQYGGFRLVWIGWREPATGQVTPVTWSGDAAGYLDALKSASEAGGVKEPMAGCLRDGRSRIGNDGEGESFTAAWGEAAVAHGLRAAAVLPVRFLGDIAGVICVHAAEPDVFKDREIALLEEMAANLSYGMDQLWQQGQRRRAEDELAASERHLRAIIETAQDGFLLTDATGRFLDVNEAYCAISGYTRAEILRMGVHDVESMETAAEVAEHMRRIKLMGADRFQTRSRRKDGRMIDLELSVNYLERDGGQYVAFCRDVTERKRSEEQLRQSQKMEAIGQLAGGVAHDFNNILSAFMMHLNLLQETQTLDPVTRSTVTELEVEARRAASLTRQLLLFGRRSVMQAAALNLNEVVENLLKMLRRLIGEDIDLQFNGRDDLPPVEADPGMLEQVVANLVVNARDAMPKGGRLNLITSVVDFDAVQAARHPERRPGRFVCLSVTDTGCGMDEAILRQIFQPYFTTKEDGKGTGLGLATVYGIVKQHHGWVEVQSEVGRGSTFRVFLPVMGGVTETGEAVPHVEPIRGGQETILIVEDDRSVRTTSVIFLRRWGYRILEAANGDEALALWQRFKAEIDLVFSDMILPEGMTGLELVTRFRAERPELKAIVTSGYSAELAVPSELAARRVMYLPKPCMPADLAATIRKCLDLPPE